MRALRRQPRSDASSPRASCTRCVARDYFADDSPTGQTPLALLSATHYTAHAAALASAQNIGWGTGAQSTPARWSSPGCTRPRIARIILTGEVREAGVGVAAAVPPVLEVAPPGATYAVEFGARSPGR